MLILDLQKGNMQSHWAVLVHTKTENISGKPWSHLSNLVYREVYYGMEITLQSTILAMGTAKLGETFKVVSGSHKHKPMLAFKMKLLYFGTKFLCSRSEGPWLLRFCWQNHLKLLFHVKDLEELENRILCSGSKLC